jgi:hypothetical protein
METLRVSAHVPPVGIGVALIVVAVMTNAVFYNDDAGFIEFDGGGRVDDDAVCVRIGCRSEDAACAKGSAGERYDELDFHGR